MLMPSRSNEWRGISDFGTEKVLSRDQGRALAIAPGTGCLVGRVCGALAEMRVIVLQLGEGLLILHAGGVGSFCKDRSSLGLV